MAKPFLTFHVAFIWLETARWNYKGHSMDHRLSGYAFATTQGRFGVWGTIGSTCSCTCFPTHTDFFKDPSNPNHSMIVHLGPQLGSQWLKSLMESSFRKEFLFVCLFAFSTNNVIEYFIGKKCMIPINYFPTRITDTQMIVLHPGAVPDFKK